MKISIYTNYYHPMIGGAEEVTRRIGEHLFKCGHEITVYTRELNPPRKSLNVNGIKLIQYNPFNLQQIKYFVDKSSADKHLIYSDVSDFTPHLISSKKNIILCMCGGNRHLKQNEYKKLIQHLENIDKIIIHSKYEDCYNLLSSLNKVEIIPNGIDLKEFDFEVTRPEILDEKYMNMYWVINISNFFPGKNQEKVFDVLDKVKDNCLYIQVTSEPTISISKQLETQWKLKQSKFNIPSILVYGNDRKKLLSLLKCSNVMLFTSEKEVGPLAILEAMAAKVPWVSTNIGETPQLSGGFCIPTAKTPDKCTIFDQRVIKELASRTSEAIKKPSLGNEGFDYIKSRDWSEILPIYENLMQDVDANFR